MLHSQLGQYRDTTVDDGCVLDRIYVIKLDNDTSRYIHCAKRTINGMANRQLLSKSDDADAR